MSKTGDIPIHRIPSSGWSTLLMAILMATLGTACKSTRKIYKEPLKEEGVEYLLESMQNNEFQFKHLAAKFHLDFQQNRQTTSFKGQVRIQKDSLIWVSFSPALGIEMARLVITQDSVKFINRVSKEYFLGTYDYINHFMNANIDYSILESLITGNDFATYENTTFRANIDGMEYHLSTAERRKLKKYIKNASDEARVFIHNIWLNPESFKISRIKMKEVWDENKKIDASYDNFQMLNEQYFPFAIQFKLLADESIRVDLNYSKVTVDENISYHFKVPANYSPVEIKSQ